MIVGFAAGGGNDLFARLVIQKFQEQTGHTAVIENKPGAGGRISSDFVAHQPPDGYTVLVGATGQMAIGPRHLQVSTTRGDELHSAQHDRRRFRWCWWCRPIIRPRP